MPELKIDLEAIINQWDGYPVSGDTHFAKSSVKDMLREAIHKTLAIASEKATTITEAYNDWSEEGGHMYVVDKQYILNVEKLIV